MPVLSQGYERYAGPVQEGRPLFLAVAATALRRHLRWYNWVLLAMAVLFGSGFEYIVIFMSYAAASVFGAGAAPGGGGNQGMILRIVSDGPRFYADMMITQAYWSLVLGTVVGAGEVAEDLRTGALVFYLSRPLTRLGYLLGKVAAVFAVVAAVSLVPTLLLFAWHTSLVGEWAWFAERWRTPLAIVGQFLATASLVSGLVLGVSALARRRRWATVAVAALFLGLTMTATILATPKRMFAGEERGRVMQGARHARSEEERSALVRELGASTDTLESDRDFRGMRFLSPVASLEAAGRDLFGLPLPDNFGGGRHWFWILGIAGAGWLVLVRRVRAVEIVT